MKDEALTERAADHDETRADEENSRLGRIRFNGLGLGLAVSIIARTLTKAHARLAQKGAYRAITLLLYE